MTSTQMIALFDRHMKDLLGQGIGRGRFPRKRYSEAFEKMAFAVTDCVPAEAVWAMRNGKSDVDTVWFESTLRLAIRFWRRSQMPQASLYESLLANYPDIEMSHMVMELYRGFTPTAISRFCWRDVIVQEEHNFALPMRGSRIPASFEGEVYGFRGEEYTPWLNSLYAWTFPEGVFHERFPLVPWSRGSLTPMPPNRIEREIEWRQLYLSDED